MAGVAIIRRFSILPCVLWLASCASTDELFAQYDAEFCPALTEAGEIVEREVFRDRVVIKEVAAKAESIEWAPAVYFATNSAALSEISKQSLRGNLQLLRKFDRYKVSIRGFTDVNGSADYNRKLSIKRIKKVRDFFHRAGVSSGRIIGTAHGESLPVNNSESAIADEINRRVELILLDPQGWPLVRHHPDLSGLKK